MIELSNANVTIKLDIPGKLYKGTRFDHAGYLYSITFRGVEFCAKEYPDQPTGFGGAGLCSEFGIFNPPGFEEAVIGEWFLKPGVGLLKKKSEKYLFHEFYEEHECVIDTFHYEKGQNSVQLTSGERETKGYQLFISRTFMLTDEGLIIRYDLENRGSKTIKTEEYIHNFIQIDHHKIGPGYSLVLNETVDSKQLPEFLSVRGNQLNQLIFHDSPKEAFYFQPHPELHPQRNLIGNLNDKEIGNSNFVMGISYQNKGRFLEIDHFTPSMAAIWGCPHALSVESFKKIDLKPGEKLSYQREIVLS